MAYAITTALLLTTASAQSTSVTSLFLPDDTKASYNASVVAVIQSITTYFLDTDCSGIASGCNRFDRPVTYGPTWYEMRLGGTHTLVEHCDLEGTTKAICTQSELDNTNSSFAAAHTYSLSEIVFHRVTIMTGLEKLRTATQQVGVAATPPLAIVTVTATPPAATSVTAYPDFYDGFDDSSNEIGLGSVVAVNGSTITYALSFTCTLTGNASCSPTSADTITFGPTWNEYSMIFTTEEDGSPDYATQLCNYEGTTTGSCTLSSGTDTGLTMFLPRESIMMHNLTITAGLEKLTNVLAPTGQVTHSYAPGPAASSTSKGGGGKAVGLSIAGLVGIALAAFAL
ncbi:uncharacterized protein BDZ99DRAFT_517259 [Mytilinidion resinicola]|uniref:GPI anchored protein n=1 Tax=Mytilinidion resinicola TaxID=574789 RepID=A0A6A6YY89_9PEZI|nr:uncharacterized protein BDZ99DRAFT_517259 [Mytilinidion resinicola]KAF2812964.1 hypothetical protein BDZ99DRAFT_517259 [Mytilinidion resinicola]